MGTGDPGHLHCPLLPPRWFPSLPWWEGQHHTRLTAITVEILTSQNALCRLEYSLKTFPRNWGSLNYPDKKQPRVQIESDMIPWIGHHQEAVTHSHPWPHLSSSPRGSACYLFTLYIPWTLCRAPHGCGPGPPAGASAGK